MLQRKDKFFDVDDDGVEPSPFRRRESAPSGVFQNQPFIAQYPDVGDRQRSNTRLSPPRCRSAPPPRLCPHPPPPLPPNPPPQRLLPPKTTPGSQPTLPNSPNGAPNPPTPVPKPNLPVPHGKPSVPANLPSVKPAVNHLNRGMASVIISPPRPPLPLKLSPTPSLRRLPPSVRPNPSSRTSSPRRVRNARYSMERQRVAHLLSDGNTSRPRQRLRTLPCPSRIPPHPNHLPPNPPFSRQLPL